VGVCREVPQEESEYSAEHEAKDQGRDEAARVGQEPAYAHNGPRLRRRITITPERDSMPPPYSLSSARRIRRERVAASLDGISCRGADAPPASRPHQAPYACSRGTSDVSTVSGMRRLLHIVVVVVAVCAAVVNLALDWTGDHPHVLGVRLKLVAGTIWALGLLYVLLYDVVRWLARRRVAAGS
jgi:hypothetical protein